jgi:hypothetical protein
MMSDFIGQQENLMDDAEHGLKNKRYYLVDIIQQSTSVSSIAVFKC